MVARRSIQPLLAILTLASTAFGEEKPNIVVIVADDLGYHDLGFQGGKDIPTPHLDALAASGVRCTNGYVTCPVCSPTRAGLLTGRYQQRFGHEFNPGGRRDQGVADLGLPLTEKTLADFLSASGYQTGLMGKWHLGMEEKFWPRKRGFGSYFGFLGGAHPYLEPGLTGDPIYRNEEKIPEKEYLTDAIGREAEAFVDRVKGKPFFLLMTFNAVHTPMEATEKYSSRFSGIENKRRRTYAAMLSALDDSVGRLRDKLEKEGLTRNTLVCIISDNGGPINVNGSINDPLRGAKGTTWEGGIRVPYVVSWPARLKAGKYDRPVVSMDIFSTAIKAAGATTPDEPKRDGVDLVPYLLGEKSDDPHPVLYWRFGAQKAVRAGKHKLVVMPQEKPTLYDLDADVGETTDLAAKEPKVLVELTDKLAAWEKELQAPRWGQANRGVSRRSAEPAAKKGANRKARKKASAGGE